MTENEWRCLRLCVCGARVNICDLCPAPCMNLQLCLSQLKGQFINPLNAKSYFCPSPSARCLISFDKYTKCVESSWICLSVSGFKT